VIVLPFQSWPLIVHMSSPKIKKTTRQRILNEALKLFNKHSIHNVSAHDIARSLGISSGNLTYYFKKKSDLIDGLSDQLLAEITKLIDDMKTYGGNPEATANTFSTFTALFWKYRFFFNNLLYISGQDAKQRKRYLFIKSYILDALTDAYEILIKDGIVKQIDPPNSLDLVLENLWVLWVGYLRIFQVETSPSKATATNYTRFASIQTFSYMEPHYDDQVRVTFYRHILNGPSSSSPKSAD
jgi:AcrR family transcriptional regulator